MSNSSSPPINPIATAPLTPDGEDTFPQPLASYTALEHPVSSKLHIAGPGYDFCAHVDGESIGSREAKVPPLCNPPLKQATLRLDMPLSAITCDKCKNIAVGSRPMNSPGTSLFYDYSKEMACNILARIADGETLKSALKDHPIGRFAFMEWCEGRNDQALADNIPSLYIQAINSQHLAMADETVEIADDTAVSGKTAALRQSKDKMRMDGRRWYVDMRQRKEIAMARAEAAKVPVQVALDATVDSDVAVKVDWDGVPLAAKKALLESLGDTD